PAQVEDRGDAGRTDGDIGDAPAPRSTERVRDDDGDGNAADAGDPVADAAGRAVGIGREKNRKPLFDVRNVDPGVRADETVSGLGDDEIPASTEDPVRLAFDD